MEDGVDLGDWLHIEMVYWCTVTHLWLNFFGALQNLYIAYIQPNSNPAAHGRESILQPVDHKSDHLAITPPSH